MGWRVDTEAEARSRGFSDLNALCTSRGTTTERVRDQMRKHNKTLDEALASRVQARIPNLTKKELEREASSGVRVCATCKQAFLLTSEHFRSDEASAGGFYRDCWVCDKRERREKAAENRYGHTLQERQERLEDQNKQCPVCLDALAHFHTEHDHATGLVRGFTCPPCNWTIGTLESPPRGLPFVLFTRVVCYLAKPTRPSSERLGTPVKSKKGGKNSSTSYVRWRDHGLSPEDVADMWQRQKEVCFVCRQTKPNQKLHVDHDHIERKKLLEKCSRKTDIGSDGRTRSSAYSDALRQSVRGILCEHCNKMLGHAGIDKDPEKGIKRLEQAVLFLERHATR